MPHFNLPLLVIVSINGPTISRSIASSSTRKMARHPRQGMLASSLVGEKCMLILLFFLTHMLCDLASKLSANRRT